MISLAETAEGEILNSIQFNLKKKTKNKTLELSHSPLCALAGIAGRAGTADDVRASLLGAANEHSKEMRVEKKKKKKRRRLPASSLQRSCALIS